MEELCETEFGLRQKVQKLAKFIRGSKHVVVYTGAGLSTAAGIPDFRGPSGVWTLRAKGKSLPEPQLQKVLPTFSHFAVKALLDAGYCHHVVSQNIDGLHIKSGVSTGNLSELHGNYSCETCQVCQATYFRDFPVWTGLTVAEPTSESNTASSEPNASSSKRVKRQPKQHDHRTGRTCERTGCHGELVDTVVLFHEEINSGVMEVAIQQSELADLAVVLGSSLQVRPACQLPADVLAKGGKLVIVNLQRTPLDARASLVIHAKCDEVMGKLLEELKVDPLGTKGTPSSVQVVPSECPERAEDESPSDIAQREFERSFMIPVLPQNAFS